MELYRRLSGIKTRWATFENPTAGKGTAGAANNGAKGSFGVHLPTGGELTLLDIKGSGVIRRFFYTVPDMSMEMLRSLRLRVFWDGAAEPAVDVPIGDFFCAPHGKGVAMTSGLFASPQGKSWNCYIPMPFRKAARMTIANESARPLRAFYYDIDLLMDVSHGDDMLYFHSHWRRESPTTLGRDFDILPKVAGAGRYLGCNCGVVTNPAYEETWWGEGEFKAWIDGDGKLPTLCGTGTEDYIGDGWGMAPFSQPQQGCLMSDPASRQYAYYRFHLSDPIVFEKDFRAAIQNLGGAQKPRVLEFIAKGVPLIPTSVHCTPPDPTFIKLFETPVDLSDPNLKGFVNFFRQDDLAATSYFYLDRPENGLPPLPPPAIRTAGLDQGKLGVTVGTA